MAATVLGTFDAATLGEGWASVTDVLNSAAPAVSALKRGGRGLLCNIVESGHAYVHQDPSLTCEPSDALQIGMWIRVPSLPATTIPLLSLYSNYVEPFEMIALNRVGTTQKFSLTFTDDVGNPSSLIGPAFLLNTWYWVVVRILRASAEGVAQDGAMQLCVGGTPTAVVGELVNFFSMEDLGSLRIGVSSDLGSGGAVWIDDVCVALESDLGGAGNWLTAPPWEEPVVVKPRRRMMMGMGR